MNQIIINKRKNNFVIMVYLYYNDANNDVHSFTEVAFGLKHLLND